MKKKSVNKSSKAVKHRNTKHKVKSPSRDVIREQVRAEVRRETEIKFVKRRLCWFDKLNRMMIFMAIVGVLISLYLTWLYFNPSEGSFCNINDKFDCNAVNTSSYSVFILPIAFIGVLGYLSLIFVGIALMKRVRITQKHLHWIGIGLASAGFIFSAYLFYAQAYLIGKWCIMCIVSFILITLILLCIVGSYAYCLYCKKRLNTLRAEPDVRCREY